MVEQIEADELQRLELMRQCLTQLVGFYSHMTNVLFSHQNVFDRTLNKFEPGTDMQSYIENNSPFRLPEEYTPLYLGRE